MMNSDRLRRHLPAACGLPSRRRARSPGGDARQRRGWIAVAAAAGAVAAMVPAAGLAAANGPAARYQSAIARWASWHGCSLRRRSMAATVPTLPLMVLTVM